MAQSTTFSDRTNNFVFKVPAPRFYGEENAELNELKEYIMQPLEFNRDKAIKQAYKKFKEEGKFQSPMTPTDLAGTYYIFLEFLLSQNIISHNVYDQFVHDKVNRKKSRLRRS